MTSPKGPASDLSSISVFWPWICWYQLLFRMSSQYTKRTSLSFSINADLASSFNIPVSSPRSGGGRAVDSLSPEVDGAVGACPADRCGSREGPAVLLGVAEEDITCCAL